MAVPEWKRKESSSETEKDRKVESDQIAPAGGRGFAGSPGSRWIARLRCARWVVAGRLRLTQIRSNEIQIADCGLIRL